MYDLLASSKVIILVGFYEYRKSIKKNTYVKLENNS